MRTDGHAPWGAVVATGAPELVEAMDKGAIAVSRAAEIARQPAEQQREAVRARPPKATRPRPTERRRPAAAPVPPPPAEDPEPGGADAKAAQPPGQSRRKRGGEPFEGVKIARARDAKNVHDLEAALRAFGELYRGAEPLVRERIRKDLARIIAEIDSRPPV